MKLRSPFRRQQLLSALGFALLFCLAPLAGAQDVVVKNDGSQQQGKVVGVSGTNLQIQVGQGIIGVPLSTVRSVQMAIPPEYNNALKAVQGRNYKEAVATLKPLTDRTKGIPLPWAQQALAMLGDAHVELGELDRAEAVFREFQRVYPGSPMADIGIAAVAVSKKDFAAAKPRLQAVTSKALQDKTVPEAMALAYSKAFYLQGQVKEAEGDLTGALEDYLRTVTLFYHDRGAVALAQDKADALRKANPEVFVP